MIAGLVAYTFREKKAISQHQTPSRSPNSRAVILISNSDENTAQESIFMRGCDSANHE
jgi:hypothetical protein